MTNTELLKEAITRSGLRIYFIAEKLGISYQALKLKIDNESEFRATEIAKLKDLLNLSKDECFAIFFD